MRRLLCLIGWHHLSWPPHDPPDGLFQWVRLRCARPGCQHRTEWLCHDSGPEGHWTRDHPEPDR